MNDELKNMSIEELTKLAVDNYKKAAQTKVNWYSPDSPGEVEIFFLDTEYKPFESLKIQKSIYKQIIKPAILAI